MLEGVDDTVAYVESQEIPYLTSSICVYEVLAGTLGRGETDVRAERQRFGGVRTLAFNEEMALEAARLQDKLLDDGERMAVRDLVIAATARSTGDHLVVADSDFQTGVLESELDVTNLQAEQAECLGKFDADVGVLHSTTMVAQCDKTAGWSAHCPVWWTV
ncbi:type II toxin-antitoxin system VapC family toxin [Salinadaptatus halalkaliphilus]|uniref:Type II toxin-antitoxin system VapC family toxin n=1 Tax=Salinadaptatus halalkaliphilus TaxID=2419781 RepID=A0A4V3VLB0_9EURY|nr:type II toxin-antitoxin system VapC family toxin [Salinadaptatus halalkaliphilus]